MNYLVVHWHVDPSLLHIGGFESPAAEHFRKTKTLAYGIE